MRFCDETVLKFFSATFFVTKRHPTNLVYAFSRRNGIKFSAAALFVMKQHPVSLIYVLS
jgi:hypothetical protein